MAMPKTLEVFKKEYDAIKKEFDACDEQTDNSGHVRGHHDAMIEQGARVIGDRVRELRQAGKHGATVDDFKTDSEVKQALAEIDLHLKGIDQELARMRALSANSWHKTLTRYTTLEKDLVAEIAARKKQLSTKVGLGNKSLPDMEKLLRDLKNPTGMYKQFKLMRDYTTTTPAFKNPDTYRKDRDRYLATELAKSKDKATSEAQAELFNACWWTATSTNIPCAPRICTTAFRRPWSTARRRWPPTTRARWRPLKPAARHS